MKFKVTLTRTVVQTVDVEFEADNHECAVGIVDAAAHCLKSDINVFAGNKALQWKPEQRNVTHRNLVQVEE